MLLRLLVKDKYKRERIAHIAAGIIILTHAYEKYDSGHSSWTFFLIAGLVFLTVALFHPVLEKKFPWVDWTFFIIEAILSLIVAYDYFHDGKKVLPICYIFVALLQVFLPIRRSRKKMALQQQEKAEH